MLREMFPFYMCVCYKLSVFRLNFVIQDELFAEGLLGILSCMDVSDGLILPLR